MLRALLALVFAFALAAPPALAARAPAGPAADWYYVAGNQVQGGYTLSEMEDMAARGVIRPATQVYDPAAGWAYAKDTPALRRFLGDAPSAGPVTAPSRQPAPPRPASANPPVPGPQTLDDEARAFLLGGWRSVTTETIAGRRFETTVQYQFRPDGTYGGSVSTRLPDSPGQPPLADLIGGSWSVRATSANAFLIALAPDNGAPPDTLAVNSPDGRTLVSPDGRTRYERVD